jgi:CelD/BcsL family acetyltransferase involved in cellulose biosynthesis
MNKFTVESQADMQILNPDDNRWLEFAASKPDATIFHHPAWLSVLEKSYGFRPLIVTVCDSANRITAGIPVMEIHSLVRGRRWVSLPFTDYCPPLYDSQESLDQLTNDLVAMHQTRSVRAIQVRWELPPHPAIRSHTAYYLHNLSLHPNPQMVQKGFKRTHRQNISTAEERGVVIKWGTEPEHLQCFYAMQLETRRRKGIPVQPWKFFELLGQEVLNQGLGFILLAYKDAQCLAGGLFLHWQQTLTYKYAASIGEDQQLRPNNLLSWTAMCWGCENGYTVFDLGRTELQNDGLRRFKSGWGAIESPLPYSLLSTAPPGSGNGKLMSLMETVIQKAPPWFCRMTGELLYRYFG